MTSNRDHLTVQSPGPWRLYTQPIHGWQMLGTVQRGMEIGALARSPAGLLCQVNANSVRVLHQRKARAAMRSQTIIVYMHAQGGQK